MQERIKNKLTREEIQKRINNSLNRKMPSNSLFKEKQIRENELKELLYFRKPEVKSKKFRLIRKDPQEANMLDKVTFIINRKKSIYLGFGGMGDFMLTLAAYDQSKTDSHIIFYANGNSMNFIKTISKVFRANVTIFENIYGSQLARDIYKLIKSSGRLEISGHLPNVDNICYSHWQTNTDEYKSRLTIKTNWLEKFGINSFLPKENLIGLTPSGSWKSPTIRRFLTREEFTETYNKIIENDKIPIIFSSKSDFKYYCISNKNLNKGYFVTDNSLFDFSKYTEIPTDPKFFLTAINNCEKIISMDTWMKTYACLIQKPTIVISNRDGNGNDKKYGEWGTDYIFLNTDFWPTMTVVGYKDFISKNYITTT